jgi:two-component system sensor histidine kinase LytS
MHENIILTLNLAKHAGFIVTSAFILLAISPVQEFGIQKKSRLNRIFLILFFGFLGILGTYSNTQVFNAFPNLRAMSIITAGLYAGPLVGTGAGFIAGMHRFLIDPLGFSAVPCSLATFLEGVVAGLLSKQLGRHNLNWKIAALICFIGEGVHMLLVLAISRPFSDALALVKTVALPMMLLNPIGTALFIHLIKVLFKKREERESIRAQNVLAIANETVGYFRAGLNMTSAQKPAAIIFNRLAVAAVSITDNNTILAHIGAGDDHHLSGEKIRTMATRDVLLKGKPIFHRSYKYIGCNISTCPFNSAIIVPLKKKKHIIGTLKLYGSKDISLDKIKFKIAQGLSELFSTQFELEDIQTKEQLLAHTKIRHLQAQINPHFLFNSLNTIASFCRTNPKKSRELILDLSSYMRKNLDSSRGFIKLSDELKQIKSYLAIEKARFGDRINVKIDVKKECEKWPIPPLIIQPLVENSIKHGILSNENGGKVEIKILKNNDLLEVSIADNGAGMNPEQIASIFHIKDVESQKEGVGLVNTNLRLEQIYGPEHRLTIKSRPDKGTFITFKIPDILFEK